MKGEMNIEAALLIIYLQAEAERSGGIFSTCKLRRMPLAGADSVYSNHVELKLKF